jgi:hypothetical protein
MTKEFEQPLSIKKSIKQSLEVRGLSGSDPYSLINEAKLEMENYRLLWDKASEKGLSKPDRPTAYNRVKRLISTIGPLCMTLDEECGRLAEVIRREFNITEPLSLDETLSVGALLYADKYYPKGSNPDKDLLIKSIKEGLNKKGKITLLMFSCPEIDANYLAEEVYPEGYIQTTAVRNTGTTYSREINEIGSLLSLSQIPYELIIVIGEMDEENYIFPVIGYNNVDSEEVRQRRNRYKQSFTGQCQKVYPDIKSQIYGWSEFRPNTEINTDSLESMQNIYEEAERMRQLFSAGSYYDGLPQPNDNQLIEMAKLKMITYAVQGKTLKQYFPYAIGLQNEFPLGLRTKMLNADLVARNSETIPFIYPFKPNKSLY